MNDWFMSIRKIKNGYIVNEHTGDEFETVVFEDEEDDVRKAAIDGVLWEIIEFFSEGGSRYDKSRIRIIREPGDKWEGGEKCEL